MQSVHNEDHAAFPSFSISKVPGPWQSIKKILLEQQNAAQVFLHNLKLSLGNGTKIRFWEDQCVGHFTLKDKFPSLFRLSTQQSALISFMVGLKVICGNGHWHGKEN